MKNKIYAFSEHFANEYFNMRGLMSADDKKEARIFFEENKNNIESIHRIEGENAYIKIQGPLSQSGPDAFDLWLGYGGTAYGDIIKAAEEIKKDSAVKTVYLEMNTPGGEVTGVMDASAAVRELKSEKNVYAINLSNIASAGYWIGSQATKVYAVSPLSETGSIGVVWVLRDNERNVKDDEYGYASVRIVSQNAKNKRPDITKPAERQWMQDMIDGIERLMIADISAGRNVSSQFIIDNYGQGAMFIAKDPSPEAKDALKIGLIDGLVEYKSGAISSIISASSCHEDFPTEPKPAEPVVPPQSLAESLKYDREKVQAGIDRARVDFLQELNPVLNNIQPAVAREKFQEVKTMTFDELMAANPAAKIELKEKLKAEYEAGKAEGMKEVQDRVQAATKYIAPGAEYGNAVKNVAIDVLNGKKSVESLETLVSAVDALKEAGNSEAAKGEAEKTGDTPGKQEVKLSEDGVIRNEADFFASVKADKKAFGMEV